ncbi:MAG: TIGR02186 family protein [Alphaproteobacteria bacterium]
MKNIRLHCWLAMLLMLGLGGVARADLLTADLNQYLVEVHTGFTGSNILLFGSVDQEGEIIVTLKGPPRDITVSRKARKFLAWIIEDQLSYQGVISYYAYAVTSDQALNLPDSVLKRHRIGIDNIYIPPVLGLDEAARAEFKQGLIRNQIKAQSYQAEPGIIERRGKNLFRFEVHFPANVPVGPYQVETLLVKDGQVIGAQTTPLFISKVGFSSMLYYSAHQYPVIFGMAAIFLAAVIGYLANIFMRAIIAKFLT